MLLRAVERVNRTVRPDITLVLGDIHNDGRAKHAGADRLGAIHALPVKLPKGIPLKADFPPRYDVFVPYCANRYSFNNNKSSALPALIALALGLVNAEILFLSHKIYGFSKLGRFSAGFPGQ
ncbi:MAG: hypothetical protein JW808_00035 [Victivallales bacterium]|nr:hypothetical protein [Victivallales bacterium]